MSTTNDRVELHVVIIPDTCLHAGSAGKVRNGKPGGQKWACVATL